MRVSGISAFLLAAGLVIAYALPGGAYDIVVRQEYGIVVWCSLGLGFVSGLLPRNQPGRLSLGFPIALAAYAAWTALSLGWTDSAERTTAEIVRVLDYFGLVVLIGSALDRKTWLRAAMGLGFGAATICAIALLSRLYPASFPQNQLVRASVNNRLSYPFGYWNAVGAWGSMTVAFCLAWSVHASSRIQRSIALAAVPVAVLVTYLAYSRAAVGSAIVAVALVFAFSRYRITAFIHVLATAATGALVIAITRSTPQIAHGTGGQGAGRVFGVTVLAMVLAGSIGVLTRVRWIHHARLPRQLSRAAAVGAVACAAVPAAAFGPHAVSHAWHQFRHQNSSPAIAADPASRLTQLSGSRYSIWRVSLKSFDASPFTGIGAGTFEFWWDRHGTDSEFVRNAHSFEFENLAELGLPGTALIVTVFISGLAVLIRLRRKARRTVSAGAGVALLAAFSAYTLQASVDWMWQSTAITVLALACVGIASARLSERPMRLRLPWRLGVGIAAAGAIWLQVPGLLSTTGIRQSQAAERSGRGPKALAWANDAVSREPWSASAYEQRALVLEAGGRFGEAAQDVRRAIYHERTNWRHWLILARVEAEQGEFPDAVRAYRQSLRLRPRAYVFAFVPFLATTVRP